MNNSSYKAFRITAVVVAICLLWMVMGVVGDGLALIGTGVAIAYCLVMPSTGLRVTTFVGLTIAIAGSLMLPLAGFASFRSIGVMAANDELAGGQLFAAFLATMTYTLPTPILCGLVAHAIHGLVLKYAGVSEGRRHQRTAEESVFGNRRIGETSEKREPLAREIDRILAGLKWRIRCYVWLEGILLVLFWLGISFWAAVALDYLPVLLGSNEMPRGARLFVLLIIMGVATFIIFWWVLRRAFVSLADHSMAVLLERQFGNFHDSLLTVVEMSEHPDHAAEFNRKMLSHTGGEAIDNVRNVRYRRIFNFFPLLRNFLGAFVVLGSLLAFGIFAGDAFALAMQRLYGLSEESWPRRAKIEIVGVEVKYISRLGDGDKQTRRETQIVEFNGDRTVRVARGSNPVLLVRADNGRDVVPRYCVIDYRTDEGISDDEQIERDGSPREGFQNYRFAKKPLKGILNSLTFDVIGADHRISDLRLEVVDSPTLIGIQLHCVRPKYTQLSPITQDYREGLQMPRGTRITIQAEANRPLSRVHVFDPSQPKGAQEITLAPDEEGGNTFEYDVNSLDQNLAIEVTLVDIDNVYSEKPFRIAVAARADEAPEVAVELAGIGSAVTPDALIPATGGIKDDYGVKQVAFRVGVQRSVKVGEDATKTVPGELGWLGLPARRFPVKYDEEALKGVALDVDTALDLRAKRSSAGGGFVIEPKDTLILSVIARDGLVASLGGPNVGASEEYRLKVVTPEELVARLDADELGQRRRFEQNIRELREMRDSLLRLQADIQNGPTGGAAGLSDAPEDTSHEAAAERFRRLQLLRSQSAIQASAKQRQEIEGISAAFKDIRLELINNRIDNDERKRRIKEQIYEPLDKVTGTMYPELEKRLARLAEVIEDPEGNEAAQQSIDQSEEILIELESILQKMLDLETFNELVELLREMIKEQEELTEETKRQRSKTLRDLE